MKTSAVPLIYITGASTATSNLASYFDQYQSIFTVGVSIVTCLGFIASLVWNGYLKYNEQKETLRHNKAMEPDR